LYILSVLFLEKKNQKNLIRFAVDCLTKVEETSLSSFPWKELARVARD